MVILLNRQDVQSLLTMRNAIPVVEHSFAMFVRNETNTPQRHVIPISRVEGLSAFMPSYIHGAALAVKVVSVFKRNPFQHNLPSICGVVLLLDDSTGIPLALMEASYLTAVRTGAASGVATKYLARDASRIVGCIGSGAQALTQVWAVCEIRDIDVVKVYSPHISESIDSFLQELQGWVSARIMAVDSPEEAVRESDIVILATSAIEPVVKGGWFKKGAHINAVGSHSPNARELDTKSLADALVICDSTEACLAEAGDLRIPIKEGKWRAENIHCELGEIVVGSASGRWRDDQITLFKSVGLAFQDAAMGRYVYNRALTENIGEEFRLWLEDAAGFLPASNSSNR